MNARLIENNRLNSLIIKYPLLKDIIKKKEIFWCNPCYSEFESAQKKITFTKNHIDDAEERLARFTPFIYKVFPDTRKDNGIIESPLVHIQKLQEKFQKNPGWKIPGKILLKCDNHLAISGSIKARGGIYEVLKHAESLALNHSLITKESDYSVFKSDRFKNFFSHYSLAVGSTGNLGLSIGIVGAQLGFKVFVHMSSDAKQWKKDLLREKGVTVIEHPSDYSQAVSEGRKQAEADPYIYFVDDENSKDLFLGYAIAAFRLQNQLKNLDIKIDDKHPLFVYLPCGVGGGPGGITFGLKQIFKNNVHCFFAEPVASPGMLLGLMTQQHNNINVQDFGLDNKTDADGLAVASPSAFVGKTMNQMIAGLYTVRDEMLYKLLHLVSQTEDIQLEPSALAGMPGPHKLTNSTEGKTFLRNYGLNKYMNNATHIIWATGGGMVPQNVIQSYIQKYEILNLHSEN